MMYAIKVEIEFATTEDPYDTIHKILRPIVIPNGPAEHYHILGTPRALDEGRVDTKERGSA